MRYIKPESLQESLREPPNCSRSSHDLFAPLRTLAATARRLSEGDYKARAEEDRDDEIGEAGKALNLLAASLDRRSQSADPPTDGDWRDRPSRATLHRLVAVLQSRVRELRAQSGGADGAALAEVEQLAEAVAGFTDLSYPLDLDLEPVDLAALIHSVVSRYRTELYERAVSLELSLGDDIEPVLADRLKLREALGEAVRNALDALPAKGGRLGFRTKGADGTVQIEIADSGNGMDSDLIEQALGRDAEEEFRGLALAKAVVERHGGKLALFSEHEKGTVV